MIILRIISTTNINTNDLEQFEYNVNTLNDVHMRFELPTFSSSCIHNSSYIWYLFDSLKDRMNFGSCLLSRYMNTNFQY